jgi:hypothetical protein
MDLWVGYRDPVDVLGVAEIIQRPDEALENCG